MIATNGDQYLPSAAIMDGSIYTSAIIGGKISDTETDRLACRYINKTGVCWEEVASGESELDGVVGCFEACTGDDLFSVVVGRLEVLNSIGVSETLLSELSCTERGLGLRDE